jgi:hypothetical protein
MFLLGGEGEQISTKSRAILFFLISTALLVVYYIQVGVNTQFGIWIGLIILGTIVSATQDTDLVATLILILMGVSGGMVLSNTTIQLK